MAEHETEREAERETEGESECEAELVPELVPEIASETKSENESELETSLQYAEPKFELWTEQGFGDAAATSQAKAESLQRDVKRRMFLWTLSASGL